MSVALYPNSIHTNQSNSADTTMQFVRISLISVYYLDANLPVRGVNVQSIKAKLKVATEHTQLLHKCVEASGKRKLGSESLLHLELNPI